MKLKLIATTGICAAFALSACNTTTSTSANGTTNTRANTAVVTSTSPTTSTSPMASTSPAASENPMVGGAAMLKTKDIIDNAVNSKDHTTLVAAVKQAGLVETLKGAGPFTVFAPTDEAFNKLPKDAVKGLMSAGSKETLKKILTYHVVAGKQDSAAIAKAITDGNGKATFKTVAGGNLTATMEGKDLILTDEKGGKSKVTIADVIQSNGVIHVVDTVLMPK